MASATNPSNLHPIIKTHGKAIYAQRSLTLWAILGYTIYGLGTKQRRTFVNCATSYHKLHHKIGHIRHIL